MIPRGIRATGSRGDQPHQAAGNLTMIAGAGANLLVALRDFLGHEACDPL